MNKNIDQRCLKDAGMPSEWIEKCMQAIYIGKTKEALNILQHWRVTLLDQLHISQKQIDCLDYFIRTIRNTGGIDNE